MKTYKVFHCTPVEEFEIYTAETLDQAIEWVEKQTEGLEEVDERDNTDVNWIWYDIYEGDPIDENAELVELAWSSYKFYRN